MWGKALEPPLSALGYCTLQHIPVVTAQGSCLGCAIWRTCCCWLRRMRCRGEDRRWQFLLRGACVPCLTSGPHASQKSKGRTGLFSVDGLPAQKKIIRLSVLFTIMKIQHLLEWPGQENRAAPSASHAASLDTKNGGEHRSLLRKYFHSLLGNKTTILQIKKWKSIGGKQIANISGLINDKARIQNQLF